MRASTYCLAAGIALAAIVAGGCLPSAPTAPPPPPPPPAPAVPPQVAERLAQPAAPAPEPAPAMPAPAPTPAPTPAPAPAPAAGNSFIADGTPQSLSLNASSAGMSVSAGIAPRADGSGFDLSGSFDLKGTVEPASEGKWRVKGEFSFPTGGFAVGAVSVIGVQDVVLGVPSAAPKKSYCIQIPVTPPPANAAVTQAIEEKPFEGIVDAPADAVFSVMLSAF